jgi:hypothetical protein
LNVMSSPASRIRHKGARFAAAENEELHSKKKEL